MRSTMRSMGTLFPMNWNSRQETLNWLRTARHSQKGILRGERGPNTPAHTMELSFRGELRNIERD